jgi:tetratricopeptide (TPR) repeat protein
VAETPGTSGGGGPADNPRRARWLPVGLLIALALTGGAVLAWHQLKTNKELPLLGYRAYLFVCEQLAKVEPGLQGAVSVAHEWIGEVLQDQDQLNEALVSYRASLAIRERLTNDQPSSTVWQRGLSLTHWKIGDVLSDQGKRDEALNSYLASLAILERLAADDPGSARFQRDLSGSLVRVGDALHLQGKFDEALACYRDSLAIRERLAVTDPSNAEGQHDLSVVLGRVGYALAAQGELDEARAYFREALSIAEQVAAANTSNADWRWDVVLWHLELAQRGDEPAQRWAFILAELSRLKDENLLRPDRARFLLLAEKELAKVMEAQAAPQRAATPP